MITKPFKRFIEHCLPCPSLDWCYQFGTTLTKPAELLSQRKTSAPPCNHLTLPTQDLAIPKPLTKANISQAFLVKKKATKDAIPLITKADADF